MKKLLHRKKIKTRKVLGVFLIVLAFVALFIPIMPSSGFLIAGLHFLGVNLLFWDRIKAWVAGSEISKRNHE